MANINEFILICTFKKQYHEKSRFGNNFNGAKFAKFKNRLKFEAAQLFPVNEKDKRYSNRILSGQQTTVRRVNKLQYVAAGCSLRDFAAATVNIESMEVEAQCVELSGTIHTFVAYNNILVVANWNSKIFVSSVDSKADSMITLTDYKLCNVIKGGSLLTCGFNMEMET